MVPGVTVKTANDTTVRSTHRGAVRMKFGNNQWVLWKANSVLNLILRLVFCNWSDNYGVASITAWSICNFIDRDDNNKHLQRPINRKTDGQLLGRTILPEGECSASLSVVESGSEEQDKNTDKRLAYKTNDLRGKNIAHANKSTIKELKRTNICERANS